MPQRRQFGTETLGNTRRDRNLLPTEQQQTIALRERGVLVKEVMAQFGCSKSAIKYTMRTYSTTHALNKPRSGRPPILSRY
jgi:transposase